ncbi:MAG: hypothetical protein EBZ78_08205, partial [Verrucomicrobia bacterium]|nr:hypothetical protein [Verrucomicrobiota bacterium]
MTSAAGSGMTAPISSLRHQGGREEMNERVCQILGKGNLAVPENLPGIVRHFLKEEGEKFAAGLHAGASGIELAKQRSELLSAVLVRLWELAGGTGTGEGLVLGAVGGFGRQEMSPASDIDLVFIREGASNSAVEEVVKKILYVLWDIGFKVGHACRTIPETLERAEAEPMIKTALIDARYLAGSKSLWEKFQTETNRKSLQQNVEGYLGWRLENQSTRHAKEGGTVFVQEPNLKAGVGGLRDFHNLRWVG